MAFIQFSYVNRLMDLLLSNKLHVQVQVSDGILDKSTHDIWQSALNIIAEHSFFLWDREQSNNPGYFTTTMNLYKDSAMSANVVQAVNEAFQQDQRASFRWLRTKAREAAREALTDRLFKIMMDNRLCMSDFQSMQCQSDLFWLITAKDSLSEQVNMARLANEEEWMDQVI